MQPTVYLAGPISGLNFKNCTDWRVHAEDVLRAHGIRGWNPMRAKEALAKLEAISGHGNEYAFMGPFATSKGVMTRDFFDCTRCDVVLVNFIGAKKVSIGTVMEIAWAFQLHTPVIMATDNDLHNHMMMNEATGFKVSTLEEAVRVAVSILS